MAKGIFIGIKARFIVISTLIMVLSSLTWGGWLWHKETRHMAQRLDTEGRLLLGSIEGPIVDAILYEKIGVVEENVGLLDNFVAQIAANRDLKVLYVFITDDQGKILAHNQIDRFGQMSRDPKTLAVLAGGGFLGSKDVQPVSGIPIYDMAMPLRVAGKTWGALRVGISIAALEAEQERLQREIIGFSVLFFLIGNAIFYLVGRAMTRPLKELTVAMTGVNSSALDVASTLLPRNDEIGQLQESYREMLTRLKQAEQERQDAVAKLVQNEKMATIGKIVAGVAHEINNPLMVMSTSLFHLEKKVPQELGRYVSNHKEGMQRIETIVRQLSDFSKVRALDRQPVSSNVFFVEIAAFCSMALKKHDVRFAARNDAPDKLLSIDKGKLHQVVLNLLLNAADASPRGGAVELSAYLEGSRYCLAVCDEGTGIAPEVAGKIFEVFFTTKPGGQGSGIGLAISKSIVEMHCGEITFDSSPGRTTFVVSIPQQEGAEHD